MGIVMSSRRSSSRATWPACFPACGTRIGAGSSCPSIAPTNGLPSGVTMSESYYKQRVTDALAILDEAIAGALRHLPQDVKTQHWIAAKHAPDASAAWNVVQWNYYGRVDCDNTVLAVVADLVFLSRAAGQLRAVLRE